MDQENAAPTEEKPILEVQAMEMQPNQLYLTHKSRARYFVELIKLDPMKDNVRVKAYYPNHAEWREVNVESSYTMKVLTKEEQQQAYEQISRTTKDTREAFAKVSNKAPKEPGKGRDRGAISGLGMLETWGKCFARFAHQPSSRELIREEMKKEFPNKHESVDRWLDAYRGYFNKGRLPGAQKPEQEITKEEWKS